MNKKFTTFLASMLVLLGFVSASAQTNNPILTDQIRYINGVATDGILQPSLSKNENKGFFQIAYEPIGADPLSDPITVYNWVLGVNEETDELIWVNLTTNTDEQIYASTFWCVTVESEDQSQRPKYDFVNRLTGLPLQISMLDHDFTGGPYTSNAEIPTARRSQYTVTGGTDLTVLLGGDIYGWSLSAQYNDLRNGSGKIYSTYTANRVVGFTVDEVAGAPSNIYLTTKVFNNADDDAAGDRFATFRLRTAGVRELNAEEINTLLFQQDEKDGVKLVFDPDVLKDPSHPEMDFSNPFTQDYFIAEPSPITNASLKSGLGNNNVNLVNLRLKGADYTYLMVDTAYHNETGLAFLKFKWDDLSKHEGFVAPSSGNPQVFLRNYNDNPLVGQYSFLFTYDYSFDELYIQVAQVFEKSDDQDYFREIVPTTVPTAGNRYMSAFPYVHIQDLTTQGRVLSVYNNQRPTISLGFDACSAVSTEKISKADGLYLIKNAKGQYLASPIHFNGDDARWETIDEPSGDVDQDPTHMPAYQWVVLQDRYYNDEVKKTSKITAYNREFPNLYINLQMNVDDKNNEYATAILVTGFPANSELSLKSGDVLSFVQITDSAIIKNPYLGYRKFSEDSLLVNKYQFNYLHQFNLDKYLAVGGTKDSILYAKDNASKFTLQSLKRTAVAGKRDSLTAIEYTYGYDASAIQSRIKGLARLKRTPYAIIYNNEGTFGRTTEDRYSIGKHTQGINDYNYYNHDTTYVYFKENNHYAGKHYYAIIEFNFSNGNRYDANVADGFIAKGNGARIINRIENGDGKITGSGKLRNIKAGVTDNMNVPLKVQNLKSETRTSTFAIGNDESPLYRRFNSADENVDTDTTVVLKFVEGYRKNEYLQIENNPSFKKAGIDYLGIWTEAAAGNNGISFYVDTAWVNRGAGYIKPQYLILIEREVFEGQPAEPCEVEDYHGYAPDGTPYDKWTCPHAKKAIPGYTRAKYLVNFGGFTSCKLAENSRNKDAKVLPVESDTDKDFDDTYRWRGYDRAGFLQGIHIQDTLIILNEKYSKYAVNDQKEQLYPLDKINMQAIKEDPLNAVFDLRYDHHKYVTWSMRYIEPEKAFLSEDAGKNKTFLMESMKRLASTNNTSIEPDIAPEMAQWIKMQNGCLVLSNPENSYFDQMRQSDSSTGGDDALIFDVEVGSEGQIAKDNDEVVSTNVVVIGGNGSVTVKNAAGKAVVITNVLGQTIANTVVSSDNATISVPQGIVVVSVEGESAVKAIVK